MRIAVDAMGGDHAPREVILGAKAGLRFLQEADSLVLYGPRECVESECREVGLNSTQVAICDCPEIIDMGEPPIEAIKHKRDSSIVRMVVDAGTREVDAVISAGNTGAFAAAAQFKIGPIKGVARPGIAITLPTFHGPALVCDAGANVAPKPHHLHQYAKMCSIYARKILHIAEPQVGIISIGEEAAKGNRLVKEARALIKSDLSLNFVGNVEGRDIFAGNAHIFICDGFVGNVILKLTEGLAEGIFKTIVREIEQEDAELVRSFNPVVERIWRKHDFAEYGGAPLLGINSVAIICHGRSDHRAISNAIRVALEGNRANLNGTITDQLAGE